MVVLIRKNVKYIKQSGKLILPSRIPRDERMEEVRLFDTASRAVKPLSASDGKDLKFYACGPTVYGPAHIGNFRSFVVQDLLVRVWEAAGGKVRHVRNLTDVDDKTIKGGRRYEPGSLNLSGIEGMRASLELLDSIGLPEITSHALALARQIREGARQAGFNVYGGDGEERVITSLVPPRRDGKRSGRGWRPPRSAFRGEKSMLGKRFSWLPHIFPIPPRKSGSFCACLKIKRGRTK